MGSAAQLTPNRRRSLRHKVHAPAYASFSATSKGAMLDLHEILDISEDGLGIQCSSPLEVNRSIDLCLDLSESNGQIYTAGQVVWSEPSGRTGLRFPSLATGSRLRLREWLFLNAMAAAANAGFADALPVSDAAPLRPNYTDMLAAVSAAQREAESLGSDLDTALRLVTARCQTLLRAAGAAIALAGEDSDSMTCRASAGDIAPPVGAKLHIGSGFSGECVRTATMLRCDDTEIDTRVDSESCRALGIRSILAVPVRTGERVSGILEVFAPQPYFFSNSDSDALQRFAETVAAMVSRSAGNPGSSPAAVSAPMPLPSPGSVLFASGSKDEKKEVAEDAAGASGIHLPRSHLIILFCAAAAIFLALGFTLAPWIQSQIHPRGPDSEQTVLASSRPPSQVNPSPATVVATASLQELQQLAEKGNAAAENALGLRYAQGDGVPLDDKEAIRWFTKAAEHGNPAAQYKLALLYWGGHGVNKSVTQAYFWDVLARAGGQPGTKDLASTLTAGMTRAQVTSIEQQAEVWLQDHQSLSKSEASR